ncbi:hypothetical protein F4777DRAFT_537690 [Nemania sp. FL0916]|nr:hypothetical protein F4777DRAFT_537690 [Nemania sp. FL0916]
MAADPAVSYDVLLNIAEYLRETDLLNLAVTQRILTRPLTERAFRISLTEVPIDGNQRPITWAIKNGDIDLLNRALRYLDAHYPNGWKWSQFYHREVGALLSLAAGYSLRSLQHLVQMYPLWPQGNADVPDAVREHRFYHYGINDFASNLVGMRNRELVHAALERERHDCALFLMRQYQPLLFPDGFPLRANPICFASTANLQFLIDNGASIGDDALHEVAAFPNLADPGVMDILVQRGYGVDSLRSIPSNTPAGQIKTPLNAACSAMQPTNVAALLRLGANPNGTRNAPSVMRTAFANSFIHSSPNPILTLLFSRQWRVRRVDIYRTVSQRFFECLQHLVRHGATLFVPLQMGNLLEVLVLRMWMTLGDHVLSELRSKQSAPPSVPDRPEDNNTGVQSLLRALEDFDVSPWDDIYRYVANITDPQPGGQSRGKAELLQHLRDYQALNGDLPGIPQLSVPHMMLLPDRFRAALV